MPSMKEINAQVISEFRANNGELTGPMQGAPLLLLTTIGRSTGNAHTTPLGFIDAGGRLAVAAANGGADSDPDWYRNILANPDITIEMPGAVIDSTATVASGDEHQTLLARLSESLPGMSDHIAATGREIPVVVITERI